MTRREFENIVKDRRITRINWVDTEDVGDDLTILSIELGDVVLEFTPMETEWVYVHVWSKP